MAINTMDHTWYRTWHGNLSRSSIDFEKISASKESEENVFNLRCICYSHPCIESTVSAAVGICLWYVLCDIVTVPITM